MSIVDINLHANLLTTILSDLTDRNFISTVKKYFESIKEPDEDCVITAEILQKIIKFSITEKEEVIFMLAGASYSEKVISSVLYDVHYSQSYKNAMLAKLNMEKCVTKFAPYADAFANQLNIMCREGGSKKGVDALNELLESVTILHKTASDLKLSSAKSNILVLDPIDTNPDKLNSVVNTMITTTSNRVKTIPMLDAFWGGGAVPGSFYLCAGISGFGKSLFMQNVVMYAAKNNSPEDFKTNGLTPVTVFISYEMDIRQCLERSIAWYGKDVPEWKTGESESAYCERLNSVIKEGMNDLGVKIPVIYVTGESDVSMPDASDVERTIENLKNDLGYFPIFVAVDYLDRMDLRHKALKTMGESGAEGSTKTRLKAREMRDVGKAYQIPFLTATQLTGEAMAVKDRLEPFMTKADILHDFGLNMIAGSRNLRSEVEGIVMVHVFKVETKNQAGESIETQSFIAIGDEKDRDSKGKYIFSKRDKEMLPQYKAYTTQLKNSSLKDIIKSSSNRNTVAPMYGFRIADDDYALSIRMFFTSENADFISISNLRKSSEESLSKEAFDELEKEMFSIDEEE